MSGSRWLIDEPRGVNEDFDQSQSASDGQLRSGADVFGTRTGQCRRARLFRPKNTSNSVSAKKENKQKNWAQSQQVSHFNRNVHVCESNFATNCRKLSS